MKPIYLRVDPGDPEFESKKRSVIAMRSLEWKASLAEHKYEIQFRIDCRWPYNFSKFVIFRICRLCVTVMKPTTMLPEMSSYQKTITDAVILNRSKYS